MTKVLMVLSSHSELGDTGKPAGWFLAEAAHPHAVLTREGIEVDFVSPQGGAPPMEGADRSDPIQAAFLDDPDLQQQVRTTLKPDEVDVESYAAVLFIGGHGPMFDFPDNTELQDIVRRLWEADKIVAAVCHGPAGLLNVKLADGEYLIAGKTMASFTDDEERADGLENVVPFLLASTLEKHGAHHTQADNFEAHIEVDGRLITGQNPASATPMAEALVRAIRTNLRSAA